MKSISIAIDGPSGAGKSTLARLLADRLGYVYVDTGAIYRSVGLFAYRRGIAREQIDRIIPMLNEINIELKYGDDGVQQVWLNGENVSEDIRLPEMSLYASDVSKLPEVRAFLLAMQREMAEKHSVIMDGRDIGTVVLPNADVKLFLTATAEDRARRRCLEMKEKGIDTPYEQVLEDIIYRDKNDSNRAVAPLRPADDAVIIDTTGNTLQQSFDVLYDTVRKKVNQ